MKDTTTLVINIALLVNERAKLPVFLLFGGFFLPDLVGALSLFL